jgi:hypothetical protein
MGGEMMTKLPCHLIADLLPLYIDGETSTETRAIIEQHLADCSRCSSLLEKGRTPLAYIRLEEGEEVLPQTDNIKNLLYRLKKFFFFSLVAFLGLAIIVGMITYPLGLRAGKYRIVVKSNSLNELNLYFQQKIPGLKRAQNLGLVQQIGMEIALEGASDLKLEKIWYSSEQVYLFYSLPHKKNIKQYLTGSLLYKDGELGANSSGFSGMFMPGEGTVFQNRFYSVLTFSPLQKNVDGRRVNIEKVNQPIFSGAVAIDNKQFELEDITIPLSIDLSQEPVHDISLSQRLQLGEAVILLDKIEVQAAKTVIYFQLEQPTQFKLENLNAYLVGSDGEKSRLNLLLNDSEIDQNYYRAEFAAFNDLPGTIDFVIEGISFIGGDSLKFEIDPAVVKGKWDGETMAVLKLDQYLATIRNSKVYLEKLIYDERGLAFQLKYEETKKDKPYERLVVHNPPSFRRETLDPNDQLAILPNLVEVRNEKGEEADYGQRGSGPEERISLFLGKEFSERSETIMVNVNNLTYELVGWEIIKVNL